MEKEIKSLVGNRIFGKPQKSISSYGVQFLSDRLFYIALRGRWCNTIVLNVHALSEEKSDDSR
jgi:hypothetical protein